MSRATEGRWKRNRGDGECECESRYGSIVRAVDLAESVSPTSPTATGRRRSRDLFIAEIKMP